MGRFNFTGVIRANALEDKYPGYRSGKTKSGNPYHSVILFVNSDDNNSGTVELFGMKTDPIETIDTDGNKVEVDWDDRRKIQAIAAYRKNVVQVEEGNENRQEFISSYDAVQEIWDNIEDIKGKVFTVTGRIQPNEYNGKITDRFQMQNIYVAKEGKKKGLDILEEIYFNKDSFDFENFKDDKRIYIRAYVKDYINKEHPSVYIAKNYVIDCSKVDFEDEKVVKMFNGRWLPLNLKYEKGKLSVNLKSNKYYSMMVNVKYKNGASEEEFDEFMLTDMQRSQLELGVKTLEDFRPNGRTFGNRVVEYKIVNCDIRGNYADGMITLDETAEEFEDQIYQTSSDDVEVGMNEPEEAEEKTEKKTKTKAKKEEEKKKAEEDEDEDDDLDSLFD